MISYISPAMQLPRKMSAHNVIASISRTLGTLHGDEKPTNEVKFAGEESKDKLYEPKHKQKLHYIAKQRINVSIASNAAKMVCPDISLTETDESKTSTANRLHGKFGYLTVL
ncbi:PREDICTED: uncharacterized protein LOC105361138 [Ceratosolen solmsi marchali]|uniref:Uncharacterized protein LOC105361138 n=1 Tax=Ceratosolen solmsi marchali TaxID=326594 RepID=A0AAJ7DU46_9HYME|nr:PREDICTED: uncharacterized protein LOC105361138 [Ceratosolen solmsi marchali]